MNANNIHIKWYDDFNDYEWTTNKVANWLEKKKKGKKKKKKILWKAQTSKAKQAKDEKSG